MYDNDRTRKGQACYYGTRVQYRTYFGHNRTGVLTGKHTWWRSEMHWEVSSDTVETCNRPNVWVPVSELINLDRLANIESGY